MGSPKTFSDLIHLIYNQVFDADSTAGFINQLQRVFNADHAWLISSNNDNRQFFCSDNKELTQEALTSLCETCLNGADVNNTAISLNNLKPDHPSQALANAHGFSDVLTINIVISNAHTLTIGLAKSTTTTQLFTASDTDTLNALTCHIQQAQLFKDDFSSHRVERNVFADAMNNLMMGVIVLDNQGKVVATNRVAREMIEQYDAFMIRQEVFQLEDKALYKKLTRTINELGQQFINTNSAVVNNSWVVNVPVSNHYHIGIVIHPLRSEDTSSRARVALFLRNPEEQLTISTDALIELFDLTQSEAKVAAEIANGLTMDEISQRLSISKNTVKTHLKTTFEKTGVKRQQALIRLIFNSVAHLVSKK